MRKLFSILFALVLGVSLGLVAAGNYSAFVVQGKSNITIISAEGATVTTANWIAAVPVIGNAWVMATVNASTNINIEGISFNGAVVNGTNVVGIAYVDSTGRIAGLTVKNVISTNLTALAVGVAVIGYAGVSTIEIKGSTISNNDDVGIYISSDSTQKVHFNNILGNSLYGVLNAGGGTVNAIYNWWGDASGPYHPIHNPGGTGNAVSNNVSFNPWLGTKAVTKTVTNGPVDAMDEADTQVWVTGTATVTVSKSTSNPGGSPPPGTIALNRYIDVQATVAFSTPGTQIEIRHYYTDDDAGNISKTLQQYLRLRWWNGTEWRPYSDGGVNTTSTGEYAGYIWGKVRADTEPRLIDLTETWNGDFWEGPGEIPCGCFIATAAYGTDTAKQLDILREFRDTVLLPNSLGAKFVSFYYKTSPPIANFISQHEVLRTAVRVGIVDPIVKILNWTHALWSARGS